MTTGLATGDVPHIELRGTSKRYGGVHAVERVDLVIAKGSVHGLVGANGAGKSTLGRIISGATVPDAGTMLVDGRAVRFHGPRDALGLGLSRISQEIAVVPARSVLDNVFLGIVPHRAGGTVDLAAMRQKYARLTERTGFSLPPDALAGRLHLAQQQQIEILRAVARDAELIVMDEPTAALTAAESTQLMRVIRSLAAEGTTIVFVSHFLDDVLGVTDHVTVMRDGRVVRSAATEDETTGSLVDAMLGGSVSIDFPARQDPARNATPALAVSHISSAGTVDDVSFTVRPGEILGISGLVGSGRSELLRAVFGADRRSGGTIEIGGTPVRIRTPRDAVRHGMAMVPESRKLQGLHLTHSLRRNVSLPHLHTVSDRGVVRRRQERELTSGVLRRLGVTAASDSTPAWALSGGNQQRVLFAKWLARTPTVLLVDEPTRGVDVGGKTAIYQLLADLAATGIAVVVVSSEIEEIMGLSHRVLVMRSGRVTAELAGAEITEDRLLRAAFGQADARVAS